MKQLESRMRRMILVLLLLCAMVSEHVPRMGDKSVIRGVQIAAQGQEYEITLLYHQVQPASDAADAKEQLDTVTGQGESLAQAYAAAEEQLSGRAVYKLCDVMVLSGTDTLTKLEDIVRFVAEDRKGWLAAKLLFAQNNLIQEDTDEISQMYTHLQQACKHAPYLYQANQELLLLPSIEADEFTINGAAAVEQEMQVQYLDKSTAQLLKSILCGYGRVELNVQQDRVKVNILVSCRNQQGKLVRDLYLSPSSDTVTQIPQSEMNRCILEQMQAMWSVLRPLEERGLTLGERDAKYLLLQKQRNQAPDTLDWADSVRFIMLENK